MGHGWIGNNNTNRKTAGGGKDPIQSDTFGLVKDHNQAFPTMGVRSTDYPELTKLVNWWARLNCGPNFKWTTFTINHNWSSKAHRDKNNVGMSMITAVGKFVGGSLVVYNNDDRTTKPDQWDIKDLSDVTEHDIKRQVIFFNGKNIHRTMPFEGTRTSIIFFESKHLTSGGGQNTHESTNDGMRTMGFRPFLKGVYGGSPSAVQTVQVKMMYVSPDGAVNPLHRGPGRNGGVEDPNPEHTEITPSDDEHEQEEANPKKKMRGSPIPDDQPAHEDECMEETFDTRKHDAQVTLPDLETIVLNDAVLKDTVVRCGDETGGLIPEEGFENTYLVVTDNGESVGKIILYVDDIFMTGIGKWVSATLAAIGQEKPGKKEMIQTINHVGEEPTQVHLRRETQDEPMEDTICEDCQRRPPTHTCIGFRGTRYACGKRLCARCLYRGTGMCFECAEEGRGRARSSSNHNLRCEESESTKPQCQAVRKTTGKACGDDVTAQCKRCNKGLCKEHVALTLSSIAKGRRQFCHQCMSLGPDHDEAEFGNDVVVPKLTLEQECETPYITHDTKSEEEGRRKEKEQEATCNRQKTDSQNYRRSHSTVCAMTVDKIQGETKRRKILAKEGRAIMTPIPEQREATLAEEYMMNSK